jgi:5-methylcytosine-specific restriction endonuclease McrA
MPERPNEIENLNNVEESSEAKMERDIIAALKSQGMRGRSDVRRFIKYVDERCKSFGRLTDSQIRVMSFEARHEIWLRYIDSYNRTQSSRRRKVIESSETHFSHEDVASLWIEQNGRCSYCQSSLKDYGWHIEHVIPLSRGGDNSSENIVLACITCNLSKGSRTPNEWTGRWYEFDS